MGKAEHLRVMRLLPKVNVIHNTAVIRNAV